VSRVGEMPEVVEKLNRDDFVKVEKHLFCHSGGSRKPVFLNDYRWSGLRFSPE